MAPFLNKSTARRELKARLKQQPLEEITLAQVLVPQHLKLFILKKIETIPAHQIALLAYQPHFKGEVDLRNLSIELAINSKIFLPQIIGKSSLKFFELTDNLSVGKFGILEPTSHLEFSANDYQCVLALIPGLGFDLFGNRLGRGLGFYDRFLANYPTPTKLIKIGVALSCQITEQIPVEKHDQKMDYLLTETGLIGISPLI